jgi:pilus assembly protein CpaB
MAIMRASGRVRAAVFVLLSIGLASGVSVIIWTMFQNMQSQLVEASIPEEVIPVVVAARDLTQGRTITWEDLYYIQMPTAFIPEAAIRNGEDVVGRVPRERVLANEFLREERLAHRDAGMGLNAIIPRGMRALQLDISDTSTVSGFLNPGNYVDLLVTLPSSAGQETITLFEALALLAVDNRVSDDEDEGEAGPNTSVTFAVTPEQAEQLTQAQSSGAITLTLRNDIDVTNVSSHGATAKQQLGSKGEARIPVTQWKKRTQARQDGSMMIIRGQQVERQRVPAGSQ